MDVLLPLLLPVLSGFLLRRLGAVLAALGLVAWILWRAADGRGPDDLGLAAAFGAAGGVLLGGAGALLRSRRLGRRAPLPQRQVRRGGGSRW